MISFSLLQTKLTNLNTGNTYIDSAIANSINVIGEKKKIEFTYATDIYTSIADYNFYINTALFAPKGMINTIIGKGNIYWQCRIPSVPSPQTLQCAFISGSAGIQQETFRNYDVKVEIIDYSTFKVIIEFYQTTDLLGYMESSIGIANKNRLLRDRFNNTTDFTESGRSIYSGNSEGRVFLYAERKDDVTDYGSIESEFAGYTANFYGGYPGTYGNPPSVSYKYFVDTHEVPTLNTLYNTKVEVTINCPDYVPSLWMSVYRTNTNDDTIDFVENYELETLTINAASQSGDIMVAPFVQPTYVSPGVYVASFFINKDSIQSGEILGFIAMVYDPTGAIASSFQARTPAGGRERPYDGGGFLSIGSLSDYEAEYFGNELECVIEERMLSKLYLTYAGDQYKNEIFNRLGLVIPNNILVYLKKIRFKIYEDITTQIAPWAAPESIQNFLIEREMVKAKGNPNGFSGMTDDFAAIISPNAILLLSYWRNGYEGGMDCLRSLVDGVDYNTKLATQNWGFKRLKVEWEFEFYYNDLATPFTDIVRHTQYINVKGYETDVQILRTDATQDGNTFFCLTDSLIFKAVFDEAPSYEQYKLINNIEVNPGSILTIEEAEAWQTGAVLTQLTTPKIINQEENFGQTVADEAKFTLLGTELIEADYKISAIAKKVK